MTTFLIILGCIALFLLCFDVEWTENTPEERENYTGPEVKIEIGGKTVFHHKWEKQKDKQE